MWFEILIMLLYSYYYFGCWSFTFQRFSLFFLNFPQPECGRVRRVGSEAWHGDSDELCHTLVIEIAVVAPINSHTIP